MVFGIWIGEVFKWDEEVDEGKGGASRVRADSLDGHEFRRLCRYPVNVYDERDDASKIRRLEFGARRS